MCSRVRPHLGRWRRLMIYV
ncbi:hypothetical protein F383_38706 [Gossypium arboreum]|uniref:Uncharacterized protein n=1 Tax=Gossypium arboreum TaxID=29729 RepID=A0A0B0MGK3_GOSAR|nr:hypothetical protein F383_38706 [Gossypium arboreum]